MIYNVRNEVNGWLCIGVGSDLILRLTEVLQSSVSAIQFAITYYVCLYMYVWSVWQFLD